MSRHTPGPWVIERGEHGQAFGGYWQITNEQDAIACNQFCYAAGSEAVSDANARLIASAPAMLSALKGLYSVLSRAESNASGNPEWDHVSAAVSAARAAIAKAEAGQ